MNPISWIKSLDRPAATAALLCPAPILLAMTIGPGEVGSTGASLGMIIFEWTIGLVALVMVGAIMAPTQIGVFMMVRRSEQSWLQWLLCGLSAFALVPLAYLIATEDFTGSSTASVALAIWPIYIAILALPAAFLLWRFGRSPSS